MMTYNKPGITVRGLVPLLMVFDMPASLHFYRNLLGFELVGTSAKSPDQGDHVGWALLRLDGTEIMLDEEKLEELLILFKGDPKNRQWYRGVGPHSIQESDVHVDAKFILLRTHFFHSWPAFTAFMKAKADPASMISKFESAVDAIVDGNENTLRILLNENPELIKMRSQRLHRATLLHYIGANGIEGFHQKTPKNANNLLMILLRAGADVNAEAEMYQRDTTIGLVATSIHPLKAGVQIELMDTLIAHGAILEEKQGAGINSCLANGRREAAEFLASRGAYIDLEGALGLGRLDIVERFFDSAGNLRPGASRVQMMRGMWWACEFGRSSAVKFLLERGVSINTQMDGFHWAAFSGYLDIVQLFLERKPPLEFRNQWGGTVVSAAVYGAEGHGTANDYRPVIKALLDAGASADAFPGLKERVARFL